jgi:NADPH:quinone reductase-like Zn-dependent oxidoreductase
VKKDERRAPLASPIYADLSGLPPLYVLVGTAETLLDDSTRLAERARKAGVQVTLEPWDGMIHVWPAFAPMLDEGREAIERIGAFVRARTACACARSGSPARARPRCSRSVTARSRRRGTARSSSACARPASTSRTSWRASASTPTRRSSPASSGTRSPGTVERVGAGVSDCKAGDRVVALTRFGGYTEAVAVPAAQVFPMPARMSFEEAAAVPVNYLTAVLMLRHFGNVRKGDRVLVHAAAGGVGMAAIQLCRIAGAEVFGTASAAKHATLREAGVAHAIDYRTQDFEQEVKRITGGRGVDIVLDATGAFGKSYRSLAPLGRLVCFGISGAATGLAPSRLAALGRIIRSLVPSHQADERQQGGHRREPRTPVGPDRAAARARCCRSSPTTTAAASRPSSGRRFRSLRRPRPIVSSRSGRTSARSS